jgi:hypothetical protein
VLEIEVLSKKKRSRDPFDGRFNVFSHPTALEPEHRFVASSKV